MSNDSPNLETLRFLRTLRVATQSALARYELVSDGRERRSAATFLALACSQICVSAALRTPWAENVGGPAGCTGGGGWKDGPPTFVPDP